MAGQPIVLTIYLRIVSSLFVNAAKKLFLVYIQLKHAKKSFKQEEKTNRTLAYFICNEICMHQKSFNICNDIHGNFLENSHTAFTLLVWAVKGFHKKSGWIEHYMYLLIK